MGIDLETGMRKDLEKWTTNPEQVDEVLRTVFQFAWVQGFFRGLRAGREETVSLLQKTTRVD